MVDGIKAIQVDFYNGTNEVPLFQIVHKNPLDIPLVHKPMHIYMINPYFLLPTMVTLEMAGRPFQSLWSSPSTCLYTCDILPATYHFNFAGCTPCAAPSSRPKGSWYCNTHNLLHSKYKSCWHIITSTMDCAVPPAHSCPIQFSPYPHPLQYQSSCL